MSDLTQKFTALELALEANHSELLDILTEIKNLLGNAADPNSRLDDLLALLETVRSEVITALGGIKDDTGFLASAVDDVEAISAAVATIQSDVSGINTISSDIAAAIPILATTVGEIKAVEVNALDYAILMDVKAGIIARTLGTIPPNAPNNLYTLTIEIRNKLQQLNDAMGYFGAFTDGTVLGYLDRLARAKPCCDNNRAPTTDNCTTPYISEGQLIAPFALLGGTSVMFAEFPDPPPTGMAFGTTFSAIPDRTELIADDWTEWKVYVQSDQPQYSDGSDVFRRYPTGVWRTLDQPGPKAFTVDARGSIIVHLCRLDDVAVIPIEPGECVRYTQNGIEDNRYYIDVPDYPGTYRLVVPAPAYVRDSLGTTHGPINFFSGGVPLSELGPGPWVVLMQDSRFDAPETAFLNVCNPSLVPE